MIEGGATLSAREAEELAALHRTTLPTSTLGRMGDTTLRRYYHWIARSESEQLFVAREAQTVIGAAVLSLSPATVIRRFVRATPLAFTWRAGTAFIGDRAFRSEAMALLRESGEPPVAPGPEVLQIFVTPDRQAQRTGTGLLVQVEDWLRAHGQPRYIVQTIVDGNAATLAFYARRSFRQVGERRFCGRRYAVLEREIAPHREVQTRR